MTTVVVRNGKRNAGFTLVELMIVIAIVAILVGLALPNYQTSVMKARRSDAQQEMMEFANQAERVFIQSNSYAGVTLPANTDFYTFSFPVAVTALTYVLRATPTAIQSDDPCGTMNMNQNGQRGHSGPLAGCW